jgi:hypothetical protein
VASTKGNPKGTRRPRKDEHSHPFIRASPAEVRDAYATRANQIIRFVDMVWERMSREEVGSDVWRSFAPRLDALVDTLRGWSSHRAARMLLLKAIDDAVAHRQRVADAPGLAERARSRWDWGAATRGTGNAGRSDAPHTYLARRRIGV